MLASFLIWGVLLNIPCWFQFYLGSFSYTSHADFVFLWGFSSFFSGEFLLYIQCWLHFYLVVSLTHPMLASFLSGEFLLHIPCWLLFFLFFNLGSFTYLSHVGFTFLLSFFFFFSFLLLGGGGVLHIPSFFFFFFFFFSFFLFFFFHMGSFSYTILCGDFLLHVPFCSFVLFLIWGVSLPHPLLASFLCGEFLLHIPYWLHYYFGSFSYTSRVGLFFIYFYLICLIGVWGEFFLHIPCWLLLPFFFIFFFFSSFLYLVHIPCSFFLLFFFSCFFFLEGGGVGVGRFFSFFLGGGFSYTSRDGFIFIWGVSLIHPLFALILCGDFLLHVPRWVFCLSFF